jgi:hypothetical protein
MYILSIKYINLALLLLRYIIILKSNKKIYVSYDNLTFDQ